MSEKPRHLDAIDTWRCGPQCVILLLGREALCHNTLTVSRVLSFTRENFISVIVVLIYPSFSEVAIRIFRPRAKAAYVTGNV
jgi:hypothetical protein